MTQSEIVNAVVRECRDWRSAGKRVLVGNFGDGKTCGCPMTVTAHHVKTDAKVRTLRDKFCRKFGVNWSWASGFLSGYDQALSVESSLDHQRNSPSVKKELVESDFRAGYDVGTKVRAELGL